MAKYLILIFGDEKQWDAMSSSEAQAHNAAHRTFSAAAGGRVLGGEQLERSAVATTVRTRSSAGATITDGPFLETKEVVGGFYLLEADDLDEVIALVELLPEVRAGHSGVEIRPVVHHG